jgi:hypothetical protein
MIEAPDGKCVKSTVQQRQNYSTSDGSSRPVSSVQQASVVTRSSCDELLDVPPALPPRVPRHVANSIFTTPTLTPPGVPPQCADVWAIKSGFNPADHQQKYFSSQVERGLNDQSHGGSVVYSDSADLHMQDSHPIVLPGVAHVANTKWQTSNVSCSNSLVRTPSQIASFPDIELQMDNEQEQVGDPPALPPRLKSSDQLYVQDMLTLVPSPISFDASLMTMMPLPRSSMLSSYQNGYLPPVVGCIKSSQLSDICGEFDPLCVRNAVQSYCSNVGDFVKVSIAASTMSTMHSLEITDIGRSAAHGGFLSGSNDDSQEIVYEHLKWTSSPSVRNIHCEASCAV